LGKLDVQSVLRRLLHGDNISGVESAPVDESLALCTHMLPSWQSMDRFCETIADGVPSKVLENRLCRQMSFLGSLRPKRTSDVDNIKPASAVLLLPAIIKWIAPVILGKQPSHQPCLDLH
jgi:hypothetical protein